MGDFTDPTQIGSSTTKSYEKSLIFSYVLPSYFFSKGRKTTACGRGALGTILPSLKFCLESKKSATLFRMMVNLFTVSSFIVLNPLEVQPYVNTF